jgi:rhamnosyltransferase
VTRRDRVPRVTVVMRSKNSDWVIGQALAALFSQDYDDFELLVVDSGSTDRTLELVREYPHRLIEIAPEDYFPGKVLNRAIEATESEILVFQNSDGVPLARSTLGKLVAAFDDPGVDAALARQLPRPDADTWVRRDYAVSFPDADATPPWITMSLPMAAMRRSAWEQHPFYTDSWGSEDTEWGHWAKTHGLRIAYVRDAIIMHSHNYTLRQLYGRRFIEGEADAFIYGRREHLPKTAAKIAYWTLRNLADCVKHRDFSDMVNVPARSAVFHWAYLVGHRHGARRIREGDQDTSTGQQTVLSRHESVRDD